MHHMVQLFFANKYEYANENSANATEQCATNQIKNLSENISILWNVFMGVVLKVVISWNNNKLNYVRQLWSNKIFISFKKIGITVTNTVSIVENSGYPNHKILVAIPQKYSRRFVKHDVDFRYSDRDNNKVLIPSCL